MLTALFSGMHFLEDGLCAAAMFSAFIGRPDGQTAVLIYDFCAFALQAVFGAVLDLLNTGAESERKRMVRSAICAVLGVLITFIGVFAGPVFLGCGNALFHVGGGVGTIYEDRRKRRGGRNLGVFVAPGALGLYLGTVFGKSTASGNYLLFSGLLLLIFAGLAVLLFRLVIRKNGACAEKSEETGRTGTPAALLAVFLCFLVVVLRSYTGMAIGFSWKTGFFMSLISVLAVVLGKVAGGFINARFGTGKTVTVTLLLAAVCYFFSDSPAAGIPALFLFNMTMPVTLYLITERYRALPGTMFGVLTLALFLGFLPVYFGFQTEIPGHIAGMALCLISMFLLLAAVGLLKNNHE